MFDRIRSKAIIALVAAINLFAVSNAGGQMAQMQGMPSMSKKAAQMPGMHTTPLPVLKEKAVMVVTGAEDWDAFRGFGKRAPEVAMMTLMMVGGSGMEHMKMGAMPSGTQQPRSTMTAKPAAAKSGYTFSTVVTPNPPGVGRNMLRITARDSQSRPVTGLKIVSAVSMTSMDMGTAHPNAKEIKPGVYALPINLTMMGPWQVVIMAAPDSQHPGGTLITTLHITVGSPGK